MSDHEEKAREILRLSRQNAGYEGSKRMVEAITTALRAERRAAIEEAANAIREKSRNEPDGESPNYYMGLYVAEEVVRTLLDSDEPPPGATREAGAARLDGASQDAGHTSGGGSSPRRGHERSRR